MQLPNDEFIKNGEEGEGQKYLGIQEADRFKNLEMKQNLRKEFWQDKENSEVKTKLWQCCDSD